MKNLNIADRSIISYTLQDDMLMRCRYLVHKEQSRKSDILRSSEM